MSGPRLYKREARVTVYEGSTNGQFFKTLSQGIIIKDLRIQAKIDLTSDPKPNTCHVIVSNCNATTRKFLETKPLIVRVDAGYDGVLHNFFVGDLRYGISKLKKTDWETKMQLADGDRATRFASVQRSYAPGTRVKQVLQDIASSMNMVLPGTGGIVPSSRQLIQLFNQGLPAGYTASGASMTELVRLLAPFGLNASIQNGQMQILADSETEDAAPVVIQEDSGMQESPDFGAGDHSKKPPHLTIKTTLDARMVPGRVITVKSRDIINKSFKIHKVGHELDTHGKNFYTKIEALPLEE